MAVDFDVESTLAKLTVADKVKLLTGLVRKVTTANGNNPHIDVRDGGIQNQFPRQGYLLSNLAMVSLIRSTHYFPNFYFRSERRSWRIL